MTISELSGLFQRKAEHYTALWQRFLQFPSIAADPAHAGDCRTCAEWLRAEVLAPMGFDACTLATGDQPLVYAERAGAPGTPTVLIYGHYDVQPPDPMEAWDSPPFEPCIRNGRMYARGAQDNKGQLSFTLSAIDTLLQCGVALPTLKILIEGGEESGSRGMTAFRTLWETRVKADIMLVADTEMVNEHTPTMIMGLRGMASLTVNIRGATHDLHSGVHGGVAMNAALVMAQLIASLHSPDGRVAVSGFYDGVTHPDETETKEAEAAGFDATVYKCETGAFPHGGESTLFSPRVRAGLRPALEVNGIASGYSGAGIKTIIPAEATAKLSARLVKGQAAEGVLRAIVEHLGKQTPAGVALTISDATAGGPALHAPKDHPATHLAASILEELFNRPPAYLWEGASIPVLSILGEASGAVPVLVGFGCPEDRIHAPNESFALQQFRKGFLFTGRLLTELGRS